MKKLFSSIGFVAVLLLGCTNLETKTLPLTSTPTQIFTPTVTATNTSTPTITATPAPVVIKFNNIQNLSIVNSLEIDQSQFVVNTLSDYRKPKSDVPDGDVQDAYFISHITLASGEILGIQVMQPANCKLYNNPNTDRRVTDCYYDKIAISAVNLSKRERLWTQDIKLYSGMEFFSVEILKHEGKITIPTPDSILVKDLVSGENFVVLSTKDATYNPYIAALSPDLRKLVFVVQGRNLNTIFVYDANTLSKIFKYDVAGLVSDLEWSNDGNLLAIGKSNGGIDILNLEDYKVESVVDVKKVQETSIWISLETKNTSYYFDNPKYGVFRLKFSEDKKKIGFIETYFDEEYKEVSKIYLLNLETKAIENEADASFQGTGEIIWSSNNDFLVSLSDDPKFDEQQLESIEDIPSVDKLILMDSQNTIEIILPEIYTEAEIARFPELSSSSMFFNNDGTILTVLRSGFSKMAVWTLKVTP